MDVGAGICYPGHLVLLRGTFVFGNRPIHQKTDLLETSDNLELEAWSRTILPGVWE